MKFQSNAVGKARKDRIQNGTIRERLVIEGQKKMLQGNILRWFGHLNRINEGKVVKDIFNLEIIKMQPKCQPRKRWKNKIVENII